MSTYKGILLAKSPYYITEVGDPGFTSTLELRVWSGALASEPTEADYIMTKSAVSVTAENVTFEISKLIESSLRHLPNASDLTPSTREDTLWVNIKTFNGDANRDDTWLVLDGYSYFLDGINPSLTETALISEDVIYYNDDINITLPIHVEGVDKALKVGFYLNDFWIGGEIYDTISGSTNSYDKIQYFDSPLVGVATHLKVLGAADEILRTFRLEEVPCTRYTPYLVTFINKFGVNQNLIFSLVSKESIKVSKDNFNRQILDYSSGTPTYNVGSHSFKDFNSNVRESIVLNTNYIDESLNDTIGQLISSEAVWITVDGVTSPVNVVTKSLEYKKSVNEGLINYAIQFEYAFNKRNSIY